MFQNPVVFQAFILQFREPIVVREAINSRSMRVEAFTRGTFTRRRCYTTDSSRSPACQENPALARKLNVDATACLAGLAADIPFILFSSDLVFWGGTIILQNVPDSNVQQYSASMNKVLTYEFDALLPGHSCISLRNGRRHVQRAANEFNKIGLPENMRL